MRVNVQYMWTACFYSGFVDFSLSSKTLKSKCTEVKEWAVGVVEWSQVQGVGNELAGMRNVLYVQGNTEGSHTKGSAHSSDTNAPIM